VAVANALETLKERADVVTEKDHGDGVKEIIDQLLKNDLADYDSQLKRHAITLGRTTDGKDNPVVVNPLSQQHSGGGAIGQREVDGSRGEFWSSLKSINISFAYLIRRGISKTLQAR